MRNLLKKKKAKSIVKTIAAEPCFEMQWQCHQLIESNIRTSKLVIHFFLRSVETHLGSLCVNVTAHGGGVFADDDWLDRPETFPQRSNLAPI